MNFQFILKQMWRVFGLESSQLSMRPQELKNLSPLAHQRRYRKPLTVDYWTMTAESRVDTEFSHPFALLPRFSLAAGVCRPRMAVSDWRRMIGG
jgi:hypothetical protein